MNTIAANLDIPGLSPRRLTPQDLELICRHRQAMFLDAGKDLSTLQVMTEHFRSWLRERLEDGRYYASP